MLPHPSSNTIIEFNNFLAENPSYSKLRHNTQFVYILEILLKKENIIDMILTSNNNKPALCAVIEEIEEYYSSLPNPTFDLTSYSIRQTIQILVNHILHPFSYFPSSQVDLSSFVTSEFFTNAMIYNYNDAITPKYRLILKIEEVSSDNIN